jgi:hypothetical protein
MLTSLKEVLEVFKSNLRLFCYAKQVVEVEFALQVQGQTDESINEVHKALHKLAGLDETADDSDLRLCEENVPDLPKGRLDLSFSGSLVAVDSSQGDHFLLE